MPENQRVMVGSLGFFDLIFVFRKRLNICCRSIHHVSAQLVGIGYIFFENISFNSVAVMLVNVTISDTIALCLLVIFSCILIPPECCGVYNGVQEEYIKMYYLLDNIVRKVVIYSKVYIL